MPINTQSGFWEFTSTQIAIGNSQPLTVTGGSGTAIADTGTSLLIVDPSVVSAYWSQVSGAMNSAQSGGVVFPCDSALPDLSLAIGDTYMANISGSLMNFAQAGTDSQTGQACKFTFPPFYLAPATAPRRGETILFVIDSTDTMGKNQSASAPSSPTEARTCKSTATSSSSHSSWRSTARDPRSALRRMFE